MKRQQHLIVYLSLILLIGCSSTDKSQDSDSSKPTTKSAFDATPAKPVSRGVYKLIDTALNRKDYKGMFKHTTEALAQNEYDPKALNAIALYHIQRREWGAARILIEKALKKNNLAGLHNNLGVISLKEDNLEGAVIEFKKAYELDGSNSNVLNNLGSVYIKYLDYGRAGSLIEKLYGGNSGSVNVMNNYAILLRSQGNYEKSASIYEKALAKDSRNTSILLNYAILLVEYMKKYEDGERKLNKLEFLESNDRYVKNRMDELHSKIRAARK